MQVSHGNTANDQHLLVYRVLVLKKIILMLRLIFLSCFQILEIF